MEDLTKKYYDNLEIDFYVIVPDHVHIIFYFSDDVHKKGAIGSRSYKLSDIVSALKATATRDCGQKLWQPNYYEHIIRNEVALAVIRNYILKHIYIKPEEINWKKLEGE